MRLKNISKKRVLTANLGLLLIFSAFALHITYAMHAQKIAPEGEANTSFVLPQQDLVGLPLLLKIEKIHLSTPVEHVGTNALGEMETPIIISDVAWFKSGVRPGQIGSAVINGHYGWKGSEISAFDKLHELKKGDRVQVVDDKEGILTFVVTKTELLTWNADPKEVFISTDGKSHLNLITCEGEWDKKKKMYLNRLIVFTDLVE